MDGDHGDFDHVSSRPLNGSIDGVAFGKAPYRLVGRINIPQIPSSLEKCLHISMILGKIDGVIHVALNAWILGKILLGNNGCFLSGNAKVLRQAKSGLSIHEPKDDRYGTPSLVSGHFLQGDTIG